jgi:hypothetical protein
MIFTGANPSLSHTPLPAESENNVAVVSKNSDQDYRQDNRNMKSVFGLCVQDPAILPVQFYLRIFGLICCCLSVVQFGTASSASVYLFRINNGSWWGTICVFIAGVCALIAKNRSWVRAISVFSSFGFVTALIGAIRDSLSSREFSSLRSCGSVAFSADATNDDFKSYLLKMVSYGNKDDGIDISYCMASYNLLKEFKYETCYCVNQGGGFCGAYTLSDNTLDHKQNCGNILTTYSRILEASLSLCAISTFAMLVLFILSLYLLLSPRFFNVEEANECSEPVEGNEMAKLHRESSSDQYDPDITRPAGADGNAM